MIVLAVTEVGDDAIDVPTRVRDPYWYGFVPRLIVTAVEFLTWDVTTHQDTVLAESTDVLATVVVTMFDLLVAFRWFEALLLELH